MGNNKILVVEDVADYREMIMLFLRRSGYRAVEAATGFEAVSQARVTRPDLIIMDLDMPAISTQRAARGHVYGMREKNGKTGRLIEMKLLPGNRVLSMWRARQESNLYLGFRRPS